MVTRNDMGSWLAGSPNTGRIEWPPSGSGSRAPLGRRLAALFLDWILSWCVAALLTGQSLLTVDSWVTLAVFAVENFLLVATLGYSIGHWVFGIQVRPLARDARWVGPWRAGVRTVLLCLAIPAAVWDADGRGLHDKAAGTAIVRR